MNDIHMDNIGGTWKASTSFRTDEFASYRETKGTLTRPYSAEMKTEVCPTPRSSRITLK